MRLILHQKGTLAARVVFALGVSLFFGAAAGPVLSEPTTDSLVRPELRPGFSRQDIWDHVAENELWTMAAQSALAGHGAPLLTVLPRDVDAWCPAYRAGDANIRTQFWIGFMAALARYESTWRSTAVGGNGRWYGLLQILPATARGYGCRARNGTDLTNGAANLSCAVRIMSVTVPRDQAIALRDSRWRGVAADWGPLQSRSKREAMRRLVASQPYCLPRNALRPRVRPARD